MAPTSHEIPKGKTPVIVDGNTIEPTAGGNFVLNDGVVAHGDGYVTGQPFTGEQDRAVASKANLGVRTNGLVAVFRCADRTFFGHHDGGVIYEVDESQGSH